MWSYNNLYAVVIVGVVVTAHVTTSQSSSLVSNAICYEVTECYVDRSPSKMCDRTGKGCHPCLGDRESDSLFSMLHLKAEYNCFAVKNDGECPRGTTKCATTLKKEEEDVEQEEGKSTSGSVEVESPEQNPLSFLMDGYTKDEVVSSGSRLSEPTSHSSSTIIKHGTSLPLLDSSSESSTTSGPEQTTTEETPKPVFKSLPSLLLPSSSSSSSLLSSTGDDSSEDAFSSSASANSESSSKSSSAQELDSIVQTSAETFGSEEELTDMNSVSATVAPATKSTTAQSTIKDTALSETSSFANGAPEPTTASGTNFGLILGIVGGATAIAAVAAFVVWKKNKGDEDPDDEEAAFSPNKPASTHKATALPSASSATTAYAAHMGCFESDNLEYQYENDQHHKYGGGYGGNGFPGATATQYADGGGVAPVPVNYGHPFAIDIDDDDNNILRRTDSILGGTGVMASTTSSLCNPFEFTAGSSYASDTDQDLRDSGDDLHGASTVSVEF